MQFGQSNFDQLQGNVRRDQNRIRVDVHDGAEFGGEGYQAVIAPYFAPQQKRLAPRQVYIRWNGFGRFAQHGFPLIQGQAARQPDLIAV